MSVFRVTVFLIVSNDDQEYSPLARGPHTVQVDGGGEVNFTAVSKLN